VAMRAKDVMEADVEEERMTCKNGCSRAGVSKFLMSDPH
jgi:hypothetical protein